jgi:hypothetical protein
MKPAAKLMFSRFAWSFPEGAGKPVKEERGLPLTNVGDLMYEDKVVWKVTRIDSRGIWGVIVEVAK